MELREKEADHLRTAGGSFQYSLRTLLVVTTILAITFSLLLSAPGLVRFITAACLIIMLPVILSIVLIYGRGYARTFCIGALFPACLALWSTGSSYAMIFFMWQQAGRDLNDPGYFPAIYIAVSFGASIAAGMLAVGVRWIIEAPRRQPQREVSLHEQASPTGGTPSSVSAEPSPTPTVR